jgi:hypothetical protein
MATPTPQHPSVASAQVSAPRAPEALAEDFETLLSILGWTSPSDADEIADSAEHAPVVISPDIDGVELATPQKHGASITGVYRGTV